MSSTAVRELTLPPLTFTQHLRALARWVLPKTAYFQSMLAIISLCYVCGLILAGASHSLPILIAVSISYGLGIAVGLIKPLLMLLMVLLFVALFLYGRFFYGDREEHYFDREREFWRSLGHAPLTRRGVAKGRIV